MRTRPLTRTLALLDTLTRRLAEASLFCMMCLTMVDVVGRYLFNLPVAGSVELTELLMVAVIFCGIALASRAQGHVTVDLFALALGSFSGAARWLQRLLGHAVSLGIIVLLAVVSWGKAAEIADYGDLTAVFLIPIAPAAYLMAVMLSLTCVYHLMQLVRFCCGQEDDINPDMNPDINPAAQDHAQNRPQHDAPPCGDRA